MNQTQDTVFHIFPHLDLKVVEKINEKSFKKTNYVCILFSYWTKKSRAKNIT